MAGQWQTGAVRLGVAGRAIEPGDRRQLVLPVTTTIFAGRYGVIIRYGGTVDYRPTNQAIEAETYGRQDTGNGSGQGWDERAFSAQVAEWPIAVAGETGASVAHSAGSLRRGVEDEIEPLLRNDPTGKLKATTIIDWLAEQHPGRFSASQLRTLQRRLQDWRALHGPDQEVYFPQVHPPGREAQFDFTHCGELKVTIAGQSYPHLLFQLILSHSGWRYAEVAAGETFLALQQGLQNALWTLGGVPEVVRSDNTSAATHELRSSRGRALNDNYAALLDHYGLRSTRINPGQSHENGVAEHAHYRLKDAIDQALILRGSRDFDTADDYASFVRQMVERRNRLVQGKLEQELLCLRSLPPAPVPEYVNYQSKVRKWCTIQVAGHSYSVPSRLIGKEVQIRLYADWAEVYYQGHRVERMERVRGEGEANVNYRHVIGSLVRKPGAFARYRFREQLFPTMHFRLTYDALRQWRGERADVEYVRILHLAATTMEATVDSALSLLLEAGESFDYAEVRDLAEPKVPEAPLLTLSGQPDLKIYDRLLTVSLAAAGVCA